MTGLEAREDDWRSPGGVVERLAFGTDDVAAIHAAVDGFCRARLGAAVDGVLFRATSAGVVVGARLVDGRRVVVKAFLPAVPAERLEALRRVQAHLHAEGFPCPRPLVAPAALVNGLAIAEELVDAGSFCDTHDPGCRRLMARALAWHLDLARACGRPEALRGWSLHASSRLWPREAHTPAIDLDAGGAAWLDDLAARAKAIAAAAGPAEPVVGHHDWSGKHFRFADGRVTVVYDWDSVQLNREAVVVGNAAMTFTANYDLPGVALAPSPEEVRAFVDDYAAARPRPLSRRDREHIAACATYIAAYTARCERAASAGRDPAEDPHSFTSALRAHGAAYLEP